MKGVRNISLPIGKLMGKNLYRWVDMYEYGLVLPISVYSWVKYIRINTTITI
jgi:hypothetical protein